MSDVFSRQRILILMALGGFLSIFVVGCWVFGFPYPYYANNYNLYRFGEQLKTLKMPSDTYKIGKEYIEFGNLFGNGNKGDYVAAQLIISDQSRENLESFIGRINSSAAERPSNWWNDAKRLNAPNKKKLYLIPISDVDTSPERQSFDALFEPNGPILVSAKTFALNGASIKNIRNNKGKVFLMLAADTQYVSDDFRCW